jgi:hypothetical protein
MLGMRRRRAYAAAFVDQKHFRYSAQDAEPDLRLHSEHAQTQQQTNKQTLVLELLKKHKTLPPTLTRQTLSLGQMVPGSRLCGVDCPRGIHASPARCPMARTSVVSIV